MEKSLRRKRLRFGLRALVLFVTLAACWIGWETKQAKDQQRLAEAIEEIGGTFVRFPRRLIPPMIQSRLPRTWGWRIEKVTLVGLLAPVNDEPLSQDWRVVEISTVCEPSKMLDVSQDAWL